MSEEVKGADAALPNDDAVTVSMSVPLPPLPAAAATVTAPSSPRAASGCHQLERA
jgi:hypothetical protein